jgi:Flp pilus assembly protein TadG
MTRPGRAGAAARRGRDGQRGAGTLEFAIVVLPFLLLAFLLIQAGLYFHAANVAEAVAHTTARESASYQGPAGGAPVMTINTGEIRSTAQQVANDTWKALDGNHSLELTTVSAHPDAAFNQVEVVIEGRTVNLLPGLLPDLTVRARASSPIEIFKPQGED